MFEFLFKYPTTVFAKGELVLLSRLAGVGSGRGHRGGCAAVLGWLLWRRRSRMAARLLGWRPAAIWALAERAWPRCCC